MALSYGRFQAAGATGVAPAGSVAPGGRLAAERDGRRRPDVGPRPGGRGLPPHGSRAGRWEAPLVLIWAPPQQTLLISALSGCWICPVEAVYFIYGCYLFTCSSALD